MKSKNCSVTARPAKCLPVLLATTAILAGAVPAYAQPVPAPATIRDVVADDTGYAGQVAMAVGGSRILRFTRPIGQVLVGNPKVGDVVPLGERTLYVLGKAAGSTNLTVMPRGGREPLATVDLRIGYDVDGIARAMHDVMPDEPLGVSAQGEGVVLTGALSSAAAAARAASLAEQYAPGKVTNLTTIRAAEQVMISVRVSEVQRSALKKVGLNKVTALWDATRFSPVGTPEMFSLIPPVVDPDIAGTLLGHDRSGDWNISTVFDALEERGFASTLAEPNLVALSGETAVFFAGGEFPVPVPQSGGLFNTITIDYKQYGVSIGFTPTVVGNTINLVVAPEVSALDPSNSVIVQGFRIPGLTTRRAKTTVELRNGQSFAIAGLIRREFSDTLRGLPGSSRLPIFGSLFRSTGYENNETEVVIIVTAHMAKPTTKSNLVGPTDITQGPQESDLFLKGATDVPVPGSPASGRPTASAPAPSQAMNARPLAAAPQSGAPALPAAAPVVTAPAVSPVPVVKQAVALEPRPVTLSAQPAASAAPKADPKSSVALAQPAAPAPVAKPVTLSAQPAASAAPRADPKPSVALAQPAAPAPVAKPAPAQPAAQAAAVSTPAGAVSSPAPAAAQAPRVAASSQPAALQASKPVTPWRDPVLDISSLQKPSSAPRAAFGPPPTYASAAPGLLIPAPVSAAKPSEAQPLTVRAPLPVTSAPLATLGRPATTRIAYVAAVPAAAPAGPSTTATAQPGTLVPRAPIVISDTTTDKAGSGRPLSAQ